VLVELDYFTQLQRTAQQDHSSHLNYDFVYTRTISSSLHGVYSSKEAQRGNRIEESVELFAQWLRRTNASIQNVTVNSPWPYHSSRLAYSSGFTLRKTLGATIGSRCSSVGYLEGLEDCTGIQAHSSTHAYRVLHFHCTSSHIDSKKHCNMLEEHENKAAVKCEVRTCKLVLPLKHQCCNPICKKAVHMGCFERIVLLVVQKDKDSRPPLPDNQVACTKACYTIVAKVDAIDNCGTWCVDGNDGPQDPNHSMKILLD